MARLHRALKVVEEATSRGFSHQVFAHIQVVTTKPVGELVRVVVKTAFKVEGSKTVPLMAIPPFPCIRSDGNFLSLFFRERKFDEESNRTRFIFFEAFLN